MFRIVYVLTRIKFLDLIYINYTCTLWVCMCCISVWCDPCQPNELPSWGNKGSRYKIWNVLLDICQSLKKKYKNLKRANHGFVTLYYLLTKGNRVICDLQCYIIHIKTLNVMWNCHRQCFYKPLSFLLMLLHVLVNMMGWKYTNEAKKLLSLLCRKTNSDTCKAILKP